MTKARTNADNVAGDISGVTAGTGLTGGGTSGTVTLTNDMATTINAAGDLIYGTGNDAYTRLALGTARQTLLTNAGATAPEWAASPQSLMTATGDILYASSANTPARLGIGSNGQYLTISSGIPAWGTVSVAPSYVLLNSGGTALTGSQTITISGISNYSSFYILAKNVSASAGFSEIGLRLNGSSASNYYTFGGAQKWSAGTSEGLNARAGGNALSAYQLIMLGSNEASTGSFAARIDGGTSSGPKMIIGQGGVGGIDGAGGSDYSQSIMYNAMGYWDNSATITSISIFSSAANFDNGTLYVYASA